jgi:hypothetical protein
VIAAGGAVAGLERTAHRRAVPVARQPGAGEVGHGGRDVEVVVQAVLHARREAGPRQDGGDVRGGLVGGHVVGVHAELAEGLAVVAADQHGGVVARIEVVELAEQGGDGVVRVAHAHVVAVEDRLHVGRGRQVPGVPRRGRAPLVGGEAPRFLRRVRAGQLPVPGPHLLGVPGRHRVVGERVPVVGRHVVGGVRIPQVHVQEPRVRGAAPVEPIRAPGRT